MVRQQNSHRPRVSGIGFIGAAALAVSVMSSATLRAQTSSYQPATDNVYINWGALNGGTTAPAAQAQPAPGYTMAPTAPGGLMMPGPTMPRSTLHVAPPQGSASAGVQLRKPNTAPKMTAKPAAPKIAAPAPTPKMAKAPTPAAPPPAPAAAAPKPLAQKKAPAPAPAPAPAKTVTASAPPPPPAPTTGSAPPPPPVPVASAAPAPAAPAAPKPTDKPAEQASTTTAPPADGPIKVVFNGDDTKLSADGQSAIEGVLSKLAENENTRVQLMAYAAGEDLTSSKARRISLSRALSVRSYLIEKGVRSTRIDVRALGDKSEGDPKNRVDVNVIER